MERVSYPRIYRIVHWAIAVSFLLLLITILLRLTWLNKHHLAAIIGAYMTDTGQVLTGDYALALAKKIRQPMWNWHIYIGYVLVGLFSLRFVLPAFGEMKFQNPFGKNKPAKDKFKNGVYLVFYLFVMVSLTTGLLMKFGADSLKEPAEVIHKLGLYYLIAFIVLHLAGVLRAEFKDERGIVSRIISGKINNANK